MHFKHSLLQQNNVGIIIANTSNLSSSVNDAKNLLSLYLNKLNFSQVHIISDINIQLSENNKFTLTRVTNKIELLTAVDDIIKQLNDTNIILTLSSHGYCESTDRNFIYFGGDRIYDSDFNKTINESLKSNTKLLAMIDACQSGTFLNLRYQTTNLLTFSDENPNQDQTKDIVCISACGTYQYDQDDISEFGYGGGLTSGFIDYIVCNIDQIPTIGGFFKYFSGRVGQIGNVPVLSFDNKDFIYL
jgi:hypothetical protein